MLHLAFAVLVVLPSAASGAATSPCARTLGPVAVTEFVSPRAFDLDLQRECLVWEFNLQPKAEFIPRSSRNVTRSASIAPVVPGFTLQRSAPAATSRTAPGAQSFGLGLQVLIPAEASNTPAPSPTR
jgi:hypothetical protein